MADRCDHCGNFATSETVERELRKREEEARGLAAAVANLGSHYANLDAKLQPICRLVDGGNGERPLTVRIDRIEQLLSALSTRMPPLESAVQRLGPIETWWGDRNKRVAALWVAIASGLISLVVTLGREWVMR